KSPNFGEINFQDKKRKHSENGNTLFYIKTKNKAETKTAEILGPNYEFTISRNGCLSTVKFSIPLFNKDNKTIFFFPLSDISQLWALSEYRMNGNYEKNNSELKICDAGQCLPSKLKELMEPELYNQLEEIHRGRVPFYQITTDQQPSKELLE